MNQTSTLISIAMTYFFTREVYTHRAVPKQVARELELFSWYSTNHHIAQRHAILQTPPLLLNDLVPPVLDPFPSRELLHAGYIDRIHARAIIGQ